MFLATLVFSLLVGAVSYIEYLTSYYSEQLRCVLEQSVRNGFKICIVDALVVPD